MIEFIDSKKCTACNICANICPMNVFEKELKNIPKITKQNRCQTCFMCELYCPADAIYVAPQAEEIFHLTEKDAPSLLLGSYRKNVGWAK